MVSGKVTSSNSVFQFKVADRTTLSTLKVGQSVYANFTTHQVSINGRSACCTVSSEPTASPAPPVPPNSKPTTTSTTGKFDSMKVVLPQLAPNEESTAGAIRGLISADSENARGERDLHYGPVDGRTIVANPPHSLGKSRRLKDDPAIGEYVKIASWALKGFEIKTALLAGHKYMINSCLGMKVNAGEFALTIPDPDLRVVSDGLVLTFTVSHIAMTAFTVRLRPDPTDAIQPCHFSGKVGISGGADNVRYELHFDPVLDLEQCKIGSIGQVHQVWRIGTLHLDPLPSAVSGLARNMIEDSFTAFANFDVIDRIVAALNGAAGSQCHK